MVLSHTGLCAEGFCLTLDEKAQFYGVVSRN